MCEERFEQVAALAAGGLASGPELREWVEHSSACSQCREAYRLYVEIHDQDLPLVYGGQSRKSRILERGVPPLPDDFRAAFLSKAREAGARFGADAIAGKSPRQSWPVGSYWFPRHVSPVRWALACTLLVAALVSLGARREIHLAQSLRAISASYAGSRERLKDLEEQNRRLNENLLAMAEANAGKDADIAKLQTTLSERQAYLLTSQRAWKATQDQETQFQEASKQHMAEVQSHLQQTSAQLDQARADLQEAQSVSVVHEANLAELQTRVNELTRQLESETSNQDRDRQLLSADRDIRDIMGARNLHIVDVIDTDPSGKRTRAFGRVFYTEGKSLVFYAFDLSESRLHDARYSFQVWGEKAMPSGTVKSLGLLYKDDNAQKRWVLEVNDPAVLQHINKVFVTIEPFGGAKKPRGQKLLYAFLGMNANHP